MEVSRSCEILPCQNVNFVLISSIDLKGIKFCIDRAASYNIFCFIVFYLILGQCSLSIPMKTSENLLLANVIEGV